MKPNKFRQGKTADSIVTDGECGGQFDPDTTEYYGGRLVCESVDPEFRPLLETAPEILKALRPFAALALVLTPGDMLNYKGVYISYDQAMAATEAINDADLG